MGEREPGKEAIGRGELFFLWHPETKDTFSGYGLVLQPESKEFLVGVLMVDRPQPADLAWLQAVVEAYGDYQLVAMTAAGERGIACQMQIEPESRAYLRQFPSDKAAAIQAALEPLLEHLPNPAFRLRWDEQAQFWLSEFATPTELPQEIREVFERTGYGCLAVETNIGVVHVCHTADRDIEGFVDKPVWSQWQLIAMPTAPLLRLALVVMDRPESPYQFESFLNIAEAGQAQTLARLTAQEKLFLAFYGDDLSYRFTKIIEHGEVLRQQLQELAGLALDYWNKLPPQQRDFDQAKATFMRRFI
jgi:hypothetical protein